MRCSRVLDNDALKCYWSSPFREWSITCLSATWR